jgi:hypothetical protein
MKICLREKPEAIAENEHFARCWLLQKKLFEEAGREA